MTYPCWCWSWSRGQQGFDFSICRSQVSPLLLCPLSPPTFYTVWKEVTLCSPPLKKLCSTPLRAEHLHKLFGILLHGRFGSCLPFIQSHWIISVWTHGYLFCTFNYNAIHTTLCRCSNSAVFGHGELFQLAPVSFWHAPIIVKVVVIIYLFIIILFLVLPSFQPLKTYLACFSPQSWNQPFLQRALVPFIENETKLWAPGVLTAIGMSDSGPSQLTEQGNTHVYTNLFVHAYL